MRKGSFWIKVQDQVDPLLWVSGGSGCNDGEYVADQTTQLMSRKQKRREAEGAWVLQLPSKTCPQKPKDVVQGLTY
jgi:hypothetical protein